MKHRQHGFTLLELVVAMSIFAVLAIMAYGGLDQVLRAREASDRVMNRVAELQMAWSLIERDLEQAMPRPIRDGFGDPQPALTGGGDSLVELTRAGWPNPLRRPRGTMQRVAYALDGDTLQRWSWNVLDRAQDSEPRKTQLIEAVEAAELRFRDQDGNWGAQWPPSSTNTGPTANLLLPSAIEVALEIEGIGRIARLFLVSEWQAPPARPGRQGPGQPPGQAGDGGPPLGRQRPPQDQFRQDAPR
jgi:general secretion pathway protein J